MLKFTKYSQAQLPCRRSYKPNWRRPIRIRPRVPMAPRSRSPVLNPACAPEGALALFDST
jgi:hypothetical protein